MVKPQGPQCLYHRHRRKSKRVSSGISGQRNIRESETPTSLAPRPNEPMSSLRDRIISCKEITEFQKKVYLELLTVPSGQTISYSELARRIGCRSPQAVGQALKKNPFAPEVPCHRVIRSDGKLGGYFGKTDGEMTDRKRKLLEAEAQETLSSKAPMISGKT